MRYISIFLLALLLSCSIQKRADRSLKRALRLNPELAQTDTLYVTDTVFTQEKVFDTKHLFLRDTNVTVINNKYTTLKYYYDSKKDSIKHDLEIKRDTVVKIIQVPYRPIYNVKKAIGDKEAVYIIIILLLLLFVFLYAVLTKKK